MRKNSLKINPAVSGLAAKLTRFIILAALVIAAVYVSALIIGNFIFSLEIFKIRDIVSKSPDVSSLDYLIGEDIFKVDLKQEAGRIHEMMPSYRQVRMFRIMPNELFVDFIERKPVAVLRLYRDFYLDKNLVLFDLPLKPEDEGLPLICGLENKIPSPRCGVKYNLAQLNLALDIIRQAEANGILKKYKLREINLSHLQDIHVLLYPGPQVRMAQEDLSAKMKFLAGLLQQNEQELGNIVYIDLRFQEPVIKFKNVQ